MGAVFDDAEDKKTRLDHWNELKKRLDEADEVPSIKPGEVWWCMVGENVGIEINGKNEEYTRPVLIIKKLSRFGFIGIPLTSKSHQYNYWWYASFMFKEKISYASLAQVKVISVLRLKQRIGRVDKDTLNRIKDMLANFFR